MNSNIVWSILQDKSGNIWFGTDSGVCRFDGKAIIRIPIAVTNGLTFYPNNLSNNNPPAKNEVWSMIQDKSGIIWFGTTAGVYFYDGKTFTRFLDHQSVINSNGLSLKSVQCMLEDKNGIILFGSGPMASECLCRYDGKSITNIKPGGEVWIRYILEDGNGNLWLGTRHQGIWCYDGKTFTKFIEGGELGLHDNDIGLSALTDKAGNIWLTGKVRNLVLPIIPN